MRNAALDNPIGAAPELATGSGAAMVTTAPRATDCLTAVGARAARFRVGDDVFPKPLQAAVFAFTDVAPTSELPSQPGRSRPGTVLCCLTADD